MSPPLRFLSILLLGAIVSFDLTEAQETSPIPDLTAVSPDLLLPPLTGGVPAPGKRVRQFSSSNWNGEVYHVLYLPIDWEPGREYPVIVEYAGNGPYANAIGDISTGLVEGSRLGYGLSRGQGCIWLCLPYLNEAGSANVRQWWGTPPQHDPEATVAYCKRVVPWICQSYGGDPERVLLCGFSRGAIACHFIGLHDDEISQLWCGFLAFSHFDGVVSWPYPGSDRDSAKRRLSRLQGRPQYLLYENLPAGARFSLRDTRAYLKATGLDLGSTRMRETGFRNHNDAWILRPSQTRADIYQWLNTVLQLNR